MLNISDNRVNAEAISSKYTAFQEVFHAKLMRVLAYWLIGFLVFTIIIMFAPWTQNIGARGSVTTLRPGQRPQTIESTVAGRIEEWYVNEGDTVNRGDTILYLSEIKDAYFDPALLDRTQAQITAKGQSADAYRDKAISLANQIEALGASMVLKMDMAKNKVEQSRFKVSADSIDLIAANVNDSVKALQLARWDTLFKQDLKSRTDLEKMRMERQEAQAKLIAQENKLAQAKVELINAVVAFNNVTNEFQEKLAKAESDRQSALSSQFDTEAQIQKMENQLTNYSQRAGFRYIRAPQEGIINKALKPGIGETVKEGEPVVSIVPKEIQLAAEIFVRPVDIPLMKRGQPVRLEFDGWPAIIFGAGWPNATFGTFGGKVFAIENNISDNGLYRILVAEADTATEAWPDQVRVGSGVNAFALLNDVPVWYEIWRKLNGFPPEYYEGPVKSGSKEPKMKSKVKGTGF